MHNKMAELAAGSTEECPLQTGVSLIGGSGPAPDERVSKAAFLSSMVDGTLDNMGAHDFQIQTNYVVCVQRSGRQLKNSSREKLMALASTKCWNESLQPDEGWKGHKSHRMWRKGRKLYCLECHSHAMMGKEGYEASKALKASCDQDKSQQQLPSCFRPKAV